MCASGHPLDVEDLYCTQCGKPRMASASTAAPPVLKCSCGAELAADDVFCGACGTRNISSPAPPSTPASACAAPAPPAAAVVAGVEQQPASLCTRCHVQPAASTLQLCIACMRKDISGWNNEASGIQNGIMKKQFMLDVCFLLDCTGSMGAWIQAAKSKVLEIAAHAHTIDPRAHVRLSFVGYRDIGDLERFVVVPFQTENELEGGLKKRLESVKEGGGGDVPEDIVGGLRKVLELKWEAGTRLVIHIGMHIAVMLISMCYYLLS